MAQRAGEKSWEAAISGRRWWNLFPNPGFDISVFGTFRCPTGIFHVGFISCGAGGIAASFSVLMAGAWVVQQPAGNSGWVDTIWPYSLGLVGVGSPLWPVGGAPSNARQRRYRDCQLHISRLFPPPPPPA